MLKICEAKDFIGLIERTPPNVDVAFGNIGSISVRAAQANEDNGAVPYAIHRKKAVQSGDENFGDVFIMGYVH